MRPSSNSASNRRARIMASAMLVTWNSSKQSSRVSLAISLGDRHDGVGLGRRALGRQLLAAAVQALLHFEHELVEMHAALPGHRHVGEEQVHQHRLAAADRSPDVEPARARRRLGGVRRGPAAPKSRAWARDDRPSPRAARRPPAGAGRPFPARDRRGPRRRRGGRRGWRPGPCWSVEGPAVGGSCDSICRRIPSSRARGCL